MNQKSTNRKIVTIIVFAIVAVILAYAFAVVYFFYISPNDISMRVKIWPFLSSEAIAEQYCDSVVEINFTAKDELGEESEVTVFGVNVREDGYVLASYYEFDHYEIGSLSAITYQGGVLDAQIIFSDETYNITIIKLTSSSGKEVSLPYVNINSSEIEEDENIISLEVGYDSSNQKYTNAETGLAYGLSASVSWEYQESDSDNSPTWIKYINEDCMLYAATGYADQDLTNSGAFIFDTYGHLLGLFAFESNSGIGFATQVSHISNLLDDVVETYQQSEQAYSNGVVEALHGLTAEQLYYHSEMGNGSGDVQQYYYHSSNGVWEEREFSANITMLLSVDFQDYENNTFKWFYLVEDFAYSNVEITADSILTEIEVNGSKTTITTQIDFVDLLYALESGDEVTIYFYRDYDGDSEEGTPQLESVTFIM